jgi:hypothetical protein
MPLILRHVLETCRRVDEAVARLTHVPVSMALLPRPLLATGRRRLLRALRARYREQHRG